ncbi:MAG: TRAM domain-containing protein, partial [Bacteroidales bacterium]|nr:TRAM domain-containing protein [Bacteroidales bacterium]MDY6395286.1 TRAM domain-containing protein [Bacteroidales bacterium]
GKMRDSVPMKEKQRRLDELSALQQDISLSLNQDKIGKEFEVIIDRKEDDYYVGRTQYDSPEVDNEVLISVKNNKDLRVGEFYNVKISSAEDFDLYGDIK